MMTHTTLQATTGMLHSQHVTTSRLTALQTPTTPSPTTTRLSPSSSAISPTHYHNTSHSYLKKHSSAKSGTNQAYDSSSCTTTTPNPSTTSSTKKQESM